MTEQQSSARRDRSASSELSDAPLPGSKPAKKQEKILVSGTATAYEKPKAKKSTATGKASSSKQANGKDVKNGSSSKRASTVVARSRVFWGRKAQVDCDYEIEGPIKDDWQVAYVWAFLIKFRRDNIPADAERFQKTYVITELKTVDEFEASLRSEVPDEGLTEALVVLVKPLWKAAADALEDKEKRDLLRRKGAKARYAPSKAVLELRGAINGDNIIEKLSHSISERLQPGSPLSVFDTYIFTKTEHYENEASAQEADELAAKDINTLEYREMKENDPMTDRTENNPLRDQGFWTSPWSVKIKIMRQLVDWNLSDTDVHDMITQTRAKGKVATPYDVNRADKGTEQQHWQVIEDTWRVYSIKKPMQIHGATITSAATKEEYLDLMNRHLAKEQQLPNMRKEAALASSRSKAIQLKNSITLADRDVDFGKFLQSRVEGIEANFEEFERQREELVQKKARAAERAARDARRIASLPVITDYSRATRSRTKVNYAEQNEVDEEEDDGKVVYTKRGKNGDTSDAEDYRSSSVEAEPEIVPHGRNTRNSRTSALTNGHGYPTRGTTASTYGDADGDASRAASESAGDDQEAMQVDEDESDSESGHNGDARKRRHSDIEDEQDEDETVSRKIQVIEIEDDDEHEEE